jgi:hypothetical protein
VQRESRNDSFVLRPDVTVHHVGEGQRDVGRTVALDVAQRAHADRGLRSPFLLLREPQADPSVNASGKAAAIRAASATGGLVPPPILSSPATARA